MRRGHRRPTEHGFPVVIVAIPSRPSTPNLHPGSEHVDAATEVGEPGALVAAIGRPDGDSGERGRWGAVAGVLVVVAGGDGNGNAGPVKERYGVVDGLHEARPLHGLLVQR